MNSERGKFFDKVGRPILGMTSFLIGVFMVNPVVGTALIAAAIYELLPLVHDLYGKIVEEHEQKYRQGL